MSTQSILEISRKRYARENEENLLRLNEAYFYNKNFLIGDKPDRDKVRHYMLFDRILCPDNCQVINYIQDKIEGKLESCGKKPHKRDKISKILKLAQQFLQNENCTLDEAVSECCGWEEISW